MPGILDTVRCNNTFGALVPLPYIFIIFYAFPKSPLLVGCIIYLLLSLCKLLYRHSSQTTYVSIRTHLVGWLPGFAFITIVRTGTYCWTTVLNIDKVGFYDGEKQLFFSIIIFYFIASYYYMVRYCNSRSNIILLLYFSRRRRLYYINTKDVRRSSTLLHRKQELRPHDSNCNCML